MKGDIILMSSHAMNRDQSGEFGWLDFDGYKATKVGATKQTIRAADGWIACAGNFIGTEYHNVTPLFFQAG